MVDSYFARWIPIIFRRFSGPIDRGIECCLFFPEENKYLQWNAKDPIPRIDQLLFLPILQYSWHLLKRNVQVCDESAMDIPDACRDNALLLQDDAIQN